MTIQRKTFFCLAMACGLAAAAAGTATADEKPSSGFVDTLETIENFFGAYPEDAGTMAEAENGQVTLTRHGDARGVDSGIDWARAVNGDHENLPLDEEHDRLEIVPVGPAHEGNKYSVTVLFFNPRGRFIDQSMLIDPTGSTEPQVVESMREFVEQVAAESQDADDPRDRYTVDEVDSFRLRFRILPARPAWNDPNPAFAFEVIQTTPRK